MKKLTIQRLQKVAEVIAHEKLALHFLGVLKRDDIPFSWDLLVSADQLPPRSHQVLGYVGDLMKKHLKYADMALIAQIALLPPKHVAITKLARNGLTPDQVSPESYSEERGIVIRSDQKITPTHGALR